MYYNIINRNIIVGYYVISMKLWVMVKIRIPTKRYSSLLDIFRNGLSLKWFFRTILLKNSNYWVVVIMAVYTGVFSRTETQCKLALKDTSKYNKTFLNHKDEINRGLNNFYVMMHTDGRLQ